MSVLGRGGSDGFMRASRGCAPEALLTLEIQMRAISKDLKVKGAGCGGVKDGTKVRIRHIEDSVGDHDIDATVPGFGRMQLKSSVVKKVL